MSRLFEPGESVRLPLELSSDSSVDDLRDALRDVLDGGLTGSERKLARKGLRVDTRVTATDAESATILAWHVWAGSDVSALHLDRPATETSPRLRTQLNFHCFLGDWGTHQAQVVVAEISNGQKTERSYQLEDAQLGGLHEAPEWQALESGLQLIRYHVASY